MRIVDCFPYFNEKELLELRINLLYDYVDKFIIVDADHTHKGGPKPFTLKKTIKKLNLPQNKIQVIELNLPSYKEESNAWVRERMQRNIISKYIEKDDICIISDCDEIMDPNFIKYYALTTIQHVDSILRIPMTFLTGRADLRVYDSHNNPHFWNAPFMCTKSHLENYTLSDIRENYALKTNRTKYSDIFITENNQIKEAGWHFSWMGNYKRLQEKNKAFLHWNEVEVLKNYTAEENLTDPLGRKDHILKKYPIENLPKKIFELERVKNFLLP